MSLAQVLSSYFTLNILIALGFFIIWISSYVFHKWSIEISSRGKLQINYWALFIILIIIALQPFVPKNDFFVPTVKVWSAESEKTFYKQYTDPTEPGYLSFLVSGKPLTMKSQDFALTWSLVSMFILILGGAILLKDLYRLISIRKNSYIFKKIGRVSIYLNDSIEVPFSYFCLNANVIVPTFMIGNKIDFKISVLHELQHHRQKDTLFVYILWMLQILCVANPFVYLWGREICELQEFACDEALLGRNKVESQSYARCLLLVAQTAIDQKRKIVCATGLTLLVERNLLKRRIEKMFSKNCETKKSFKIALGFFLSLAMSVTAYASANLVRDRRVSMSEAQDLVRSAQKNSSFPIVMNDLVLQELNRYLGTPEGREFMRKALARMENYRPAISRLLQEYQLPEELMAVPIIESGYQNLPQSDNKSWGAGLWMFIESTARNYGLRVDATIDERLNPEILTDAAMRYISANYFRFKDYQLAMLGYNIGERRVQEGIDKLGTRDAWYLTKHGYQGDKYLARLMAAILIMKNPDSVK
ncbi:MAG: M56 family metallopeptidase [Pseudobdellovibrionaceae bacterium]